MPVRTALWMLAFAAALVGVASGAMALQASTDYGSATEGVAESAATTLTDPAGAAAVPPVDPQPVLDEAQAIARDLVPTGVEADVGASADVSVSVGADPAAEDAAPAAASGEPSLPATVWNAVPQDPVGRSVFVGVLLGALALAVEAFRFLFARLGAPVGRILRALAGILPAFALFSRIERGTLLDNPVRARVQDAIAQDPGMSLSEVSSRAGIAWGTTVHHLRRLEAHGMVVSINQAPHRRFFAANSPAASHRGAVAVILQPTARRIAELVSARPGIDQTGVCEALGLKNPSASKHLRAFETQGLVESARTGRSRHYHPTAALGAALDIVQQSRMSVGARPRATSQIPALAPPAHLRPALASSVTGA